MISVSIVALICCYHIRTIVVKYSIVVLFSLSWCYVVVLFLLWTWSWFLYGFYDISLYYIYNNCYPLTAVVFEKLAASHRKINKIETSIKIDTSHSLWAVKFAAQNCSCWKPFRMMIEEVLTTPSHPKMKLVSCPDIQNCHTRQDALQQLPTWNR